MVAEKYARIGNCLLPWRVTYNAVIVLIWSNVAKRYNQKQRFDCRRLIWEPLDTNRAILLRLLRVPKPNGRVEPLQISLYPYVRVYYGLPTIDWNNGNFFDVRVLRTHISGH